MIMNKTSGGDSLPTNARANIMKLVTIIAAAAIAVSALPAAAAVPLVNSPITVTSADLGKSFTYNYNGIIDEQNQSGLTAAIKFTLTGVASNVWTFSAAVDNTLSTAPVGGRPLAKEENRRKGPRHRLAPHDEVEDHRHGHESGPGEQRGSEERQSH